VFSMKKLMLPTLKTLQHCANHIQSITTLQSRQLQTRLQSTCYQAINKCQLAASAPKQSSPVL
jgi:hypothetical protein